MIGVLELESLDHQEKNTSSPIESKRNALNMSKVGWAQKNSGQFTLRFQAVHSSPSYNGPIKRVPRQTSLHAEFSLPGPWFKRTSNVIKCLFTRTLRHCIRFYGCGCSLKWTSAETRFTLVKASHAENVMLKQEPRSVT